jgi:hypothetical protein
MKTKFPLFVIGLLFATFLMISCSKGGISPADNDGGPHDIVPTDTIAPQLQIYSPSANEEFANGQIINIRGKLTDDYGLYRGTVKLTNDANGNAVFYQAYEIHGLIQYDISVNYHVSVTSVTNYTLTISFEDHGNNIVTKTINIKARP